MGIKSLHLSAQKGISCSDNYKQPTTIICQDHLKRRSNDHSKGVTSDKIGHIHPVIVERKLITNLLHIHKSRKDKVLKTLDYKF